MTYEVGDVMERHKVCTYLHQGKTVYSKVGSEQDPRWGTIMRDLREDEVDGEIVHYFEGYGEEQDIPQSDGSISTVKTIKVRVVYEPKVGEPLVISDPNVT